MDGIAQTNRNLPKTRTRSAQKGRWAADVLAIVAVLTLTASRVPADTPPAKADLDTVTVEGKRLRETLERQVSAFVSAITVRPTRESLARWGTPICPLVAGLTRDQGEFVLARLSQIVASAGAPLAPKDCHANFYIVATADPAALLKAWRKRDARMFGDGNEPKIRRFFDTPRPVRIWYNADVDGAGGMPLSADAGSSLGIGAMSGPAQGGNTQAFSGIPTNTHARLSRLQFDELQELSSVIVIVDARRMQGINFGQLADYITLIGLTEVNLDADLGHAPTLLRLFAGGADATPPGLTDWDQAFLKAMYHTDQSDKMQLSVVETSIVRELVP